MRRNWALPAYDVFKSLAITSSTPQTFPGSRIKVLRAFYGTGGKLLSVGEVVTLPEPSALGAIACGRAEKI